MANFLVPAHALLADQDHMDGWDWVWGGLMMAFWVAVVVAGVWFAVSRAHSGNRVRRARDILDERYARGELGTDEYRERVSELG